MLSQLMRALEFGANGVMVPHCRSAEEARQWVEWTRFPPLGKRGFDGAGADGTDIVDFCFAAEVGAGIAGVATGANGFNHGLGDGGDPALVGGDELVNGAGVAVLGGDAGADGDYGLANPLQFLQEQNEETFLVLQIEDRESVECVDKIAAVEGVDLLFVGPADLSISYGVPLQREHALVQQAMDKVANAAAKAGKWWGTVTPTPESAQLELDRGARMVTCADDHFLLVQGLQNACRQFGNIGIR